ncbi:efflux RND transporter periplasmic adaptor subunit [Maridesulfovibrio ferrireducens]|uniref:efflux RND transporter periplasmic adaptor subunit n=1 Tax=Maridesulfovibrio ferrireducens TaxID=246191 RepID=UPI001A33A9C7|nr:efflux RND transporter periplasmic adaptor subunit [Maridesulfovibrio ferrireducens]MBI9109600.1 efflux RND transporter periplasmic adaptor subunit [Maridesulfovibrio ferrireducens]
MGKKCFLVAGLGVGVTLLVLWLVGVFNSGVIQPGRVVPTRPVEEPALTDQAEIIVVPVMYEAVGTIRPKTETNIEAQVTGKVLTVLVRAGDKVSKNDKLIVLDSRGFQTRLESAEQGLKSAEASHRQAGEAINAAKAASYTATSTWKRMKTLFDSKVATLDELDRVEAQYLQAKAYLAQANDGLAAASAGVKQASKAVEEAQINLGYTTISANTDGEVAKRMVEPGDIAFPGKSLMLIQTSGSLRLEALVREGVIGKVRPGVKLSVEVQALGERTVGIVEEVVPSADPSTRSFLVKIGLDPIPGLYPGMFGRLLVPLREKEVVVVPVHAVSRVGQLETVLIKNGEVWDPVYVRTGNVYEDKIEILSGLRGNETLGMTALEAGGESK